jgi:hypothetical protein
LAVILGHCLSSEYLLSQQFINHWHIGIFQCPVQQEEGETCLKVSIFEVQSILKAFSAHLNHKSLKKLPPIALLWRKMSPIDLNLKFLSLSSSKLRVCTMAGCLRDCNISKMLEEFLRSLSVYRMNGEKSYIALLYNGL